ncbi:hypothetical protein AB0K15_41735 [Amycolatopsis sp. NPDC049253]|uniref:hypothetical protein n=1 Tax=Amycolatopsis sp. NPDC049253 TaxID=3155274 RepID=UPI00341D1358
MHEAGYDLVLADIDEAGLARVATERGGAITLTADLTAPDSSARLTGVARATPGIWGLVNCTGISLIKHARPIPLGRAQTAAEVGALAVLLLGPGARSVSGGMPTVTFDFAHAAAAIRAGVAR